MIKELLVIVTVFWCSGVSCQSVIPEDFFFEILPVKPVPIKPIKPLDPYNGLNPTEGQFPWVVLIERLRKDDYTKRESSFIGALISVNFVLTQARYLSKSDDKTYRLSFGATTNTNASYVIQYSNKVKIHGSYNASNSYNFNIALIKIPMPLSFSLTISSITLNDNLTEFFWKEVFFVTHVPIGPNNTNYAKKYNFLTLGNPGICKVLVPSRNLTHEICTLGTISNPLQNPCTFHQGLIAVFKYNRWILLGIGNSLGGCSLFTPRTFTRIDLFEECVSDLAGINGFSSHS